MNIILKYLYFTYVIILFFTASSAYSQSLPICYTDNCSDTKSTNCRTSASIPCIDVDDIDPTKIAPGEQLGGITSTATTPTQAELPAAADVEDGVTVGSQTGTLKVPNKSKVLSTDTVRGTAGTITDHSSTDWNYDQSFPGAGKYTQGVQNIGNINASKIFDDTTILGVEGTFNLPSPITSININIGSEHLTANIHRTKDTAQINHTQIGTLDPANTSAGYRMRSIVTQDQWGLIGAGGFGLNPNITVQTRPTSPCGLSGTLTERISSCNITWLAKNNGNAGEGDWKLVTRTNDGTEVWQDQRTKLLWSDYLGDANWCKAVGSRDPNDPDNYCNDNTYQPTSAPESWCKEKASPFVTPEAYNTAKGNLNLSSSPQVKWRLPTISDYHIAVTNGIHLVLPNMPGQYFWSASVSSYNTESALRLNGSTGYFHVNTRNNIHAVRCVGSML